MKGDAESPLAGGEADASALVLGDTEFKYRPDPSWPSELFRGIDVAGIDVDPVTGQLISFARSRSPLSVLDTNGRMIEQWGKGVFCNPHGVCVSYDGLWCADDGDHTVRHMSRSGEVLAVLGKEGAPSPFMSGRPFNRCTQVASGENGELFVADGYGNAKIHRFDRNGTWLGSFGESGVSPGEFNLPHAIVFRDGLLYIADRENHRIQVCRADGTVVDIWTQLHRPSALAPLVEGGWVVAELGPSWPFSRGAPNLGPRLTILAADGSVVTRLQTEPAAGVSPGQLVAPHDVAVDGHGNIYIAQVPLAGWELMFPGRPLSPHRRGLIKWERVR